jgi:predicted kinase
MSVRATLVYLYGPPAVGKLTVATELERLTGFRLFHNHVTVNAIRSVFDFASDPFTEVLHRTRLDVFETATRHGVDVIFTNNSIWGGDGGRVLFAEFARTARERVEAAGGRVVFVQLDAPPEVLEARVDAASRREHGKLVDPVRLRQMLELHERAPLHADDVVIDTSATSAIDAARMIAAACR